MDRIRIVVIQKPLETVNFVAGSVVAARDIEIVGTASGHRAGLDMVRACAPDIVVARDNSRIVEFTASVKRENPETGIIIVSDERDPASAKRVVAALSGGAFDFVAESAKSGTVQSLLLSKIRCCSIKQYSRRARDVGSQKSPAPDSELKENIPVNKAVGKPGVSIRPKFDAILIGVSTGGPEALMRMMPYFPASIPIPIIIVLHMPKEFTGPMALALDRKTHIRVKETQDGEEPERGKAYLAAGGIHCVLRLESPGKIRLHTMEGPPENGCRPSVDALFRSAAPIFQARTLAVVLTGMGIDGTKGSESVKKHGGFVLVQDEQSSVVWGMPGSIVRAGLANEIAPLDQIPARVCELIGM